MEHELETAPNIRLKYSECIVRGMSLKAPCFHDGRCDGRLLLLGPKNVHELERMAWGI